MAPVDIVCITMFDAYNDKVHEYRNTNIDNQRTFVLLLFIVSSVKMKETSMTRRKRALISSDTTAYTTETFLHLSAIVKEP